MRRWRGGGCYCKLENYYDPQKRQLADAEVRGAGLGWPPCVRAVQQLWGPGVGLQRLQGPTVGLRASLSSGRAAGCAVQRWGCGHARGPLGRTQPVATPAWPQTHPPSQPCCPPGLQDVKKIMDAWKTAQAESEVLYRSKFPACPCPCRRVRAGARRSAQRAAAGAGCQLNNQGAMELCGGGGHRHR